MTRSMPTTAHPLVAPTITARRDRRFDQYDLLICDVERLALRDSVNAAEAGETLSRATDRGIRVVREQTGPALWSRPRALLVTSSLDETAAARAQGIDTLYLLGRTNGLRAVAICARTARPTYVAMDIRALDLPAVSDRPTRGILADISPRGRARLHRPFLGSPHEVLDAVVAAAWRAMDRNSIFFNTRPELWRDVETALTHYWRQKMK